MHALLSTVLGFTLDRAALEGDGQERRLAGEGEPCHASCDEGHDSHCDQQNAAGVYALSCDMHPITSCDADCQPFPSPPVAPWLGSAGTYPSPPPPPPPPEQELLVAAWIFFTVTLVIFCGAVLCVCYRKRGESRSVVAFWCCCLIPLFKERRGRWEGGELRESAIPPVLLLSKR